MPVSVTMPRLGESVTEGTVTRWLKKEGDQVTADEPLLEVSTDKVDTEVPSPASGVLTSIKVAEDETVEIGVELAVISDASDERADRPGTATADETSAETAADGANGTADRVVADEEAPDRDAADESGADETEPESESQSQAPPQRRAAASQAPEPAAPAAPPHTAEPPAPPAHPAEPPAAPAPPPTSPPTSPPKAPQQPPSASARQAPSSAGPATDDDEVAGAYVTPLVRKLASEHGVDLNTLTGTGLGGRIRKSDVLNAARVAAEAAQETVAPEAEPAPAEADAGAAASVSTSGVSAASLRGQTLKLSRLRQVIATRMVESLKTSAQLTTVVEVDITRIARLRAKARNDFERREGAKLTFLPFFAIAAVEALKVHPTVNSSVDIEANTVIYHDAEHLGLAVDTSRGLLVPVIHNAGDLNLAGIARKIADLAKRARTNKVSPDELGGGTFTLTNTGSLGALFDTPIINQPQVGILGTGAVVKRPVVISDENLGETIAIRSMVYLALSYDHRIVDGADAARFLNTVKERLQAGAFERALGLG